MTLRLVAEMKGMLNEESFHKWATFLGAKQPVLTRRNNYINKSCFFNPTYF